MTPQRREMAEEEKQEKDPSVPPAETTANGTSTILNSSSVIPTSYSSKCDEGEGETVIVSSPNGGPSYVICTSKDPFVNPFETEDLTHEEVNSQLNLNLGQRLMNPNNKTLLWIIRFFNDTFVAWWEHVAYKVWDAVPITFRRWITFVAWNKVYYPLHRLLLGRSTAIHPEASEPYHALTTIMWWGRLFPITVQRIRFSLSQLSVWTPTPILSQIETINEPVASLVDNIAPPEEQKDHCTVQGLYVHSSTGDSDWCLFWIYGGAFLAGDTHGNTGPAEMVGRQTNMDVFLPQHRLCPESTMNDMMWDICLAYTWLCQHRKRQGKDPCKILLLGISSGAGLAVRLLQSIAESRRDNDNPLPNYLSIILSSNDNDVPMPAGAALLGPFADYTTAKGSLIHYAEHDLIVNQRVLDAGLPYLDTHMNGQRQEHSPVHRSFVDLPPLCVVCSQHEAVYDHAVDVVNKARAAGVPVTVAVWKYMCHVFPFLSGFIPEGEQAMNFVMEWLRRRQQQQRNHLHPEKNAVLWNSRPRHVSGTLT
jgi:acetyl esterase/lipase